LECAGTTALSLAPVARIPPHCGKKDCAGLVLYFGIDGLFHFISDIIGLVYFALSGLERILDSGIPG